jgi:ABC-type transporter Mla subunit MlaD
MDSAKDLSLESEQTVFLWTALFTEGIISMLKNIIANLLLLFSFAALISCDFGDLTLTAQFNEIDSLATGDRILYHNEYIGDVEKISRTNEGHYAVKLDIDSDYKKQLTAYSIFYIDNDPDRPNQKAVFTEQSKPGGIPLTDNSVVVGLDHPPFLKHMLDDLNRKTEELASALAEKIGLAKESYKEQSKELTRQLEEALTEIERKLGELEKEVQTAPDSEEAKALKRKLDKMIGDLETTLGKAATTIGQELSDSLQRSLENLKHRLDELNRGNQPSFQQERQKGDDGIEI